MQSLQRIQRLVLHGLRVTDARGDVLRVVDRILFLNQVRHVDVSVTATADGDREVRVEYTDGTRLVYGGDAARTLERALGPQTRTPPTPTPTPPQPHVDSKTQERDGGGGCILDGENSY